MALINHIHPGSSAEARSHGNIPIRDCCVLSKVYGSPTEDVAQPFRFTGRRWAGERGECLYYRRDYLPIIGRLMAGVNGFQVTGGASMVCLEFRGLA